MEKIHSLSLPKLFNWVLCIKFLQRDPLEYLHIIDNNKLIKLFRFGEHHAILQIEYQAITHSLAISTNKPSIAELHIDEISAYIKSVFDLDANLELFYRQAAEDYILAPLIKQYIGLRLVGIPNLFECISWAIIGQQINLNFAFKLKSRLIETFGEFTNYGSRRIYLFPKPDTIQNQNINTLRTLQFSKQKAKYLIEIARAFSNDEISKEIIMDLPDSEARTAFLCTIKGIGPWTAAYALMKSCQDYTAFPIQDAGLQNALKSTLGLDRKPTKEEMYALAAKWKGWEAYATFYLWQTLS